MGAWGYKALESDEGLDVICFLEREYSDTNEFNLSKVIESMKGELLGNDIDEIDFLYDNTVIALSELYFEFKDCGALNIEGLKHIKNFTVDRESLQWIHKRLQSIKNNEPGKDGIREIVDIWKESNLWKKRENHINELIEIIK
ncbi:PF14078 domain protein [Leptospira noguchii str. 2006001870]|nr:PF14078 domain protein [Leptospira noguchii str. 2006001870]